MENYQEKHMLLLILRSPMVFEAVVELLAELEVESIVLKGSQISGPEAEQKLEVPMVGGFLRLLEKDAPDSKAILTIMEDDAMNVFEKRCEEMVGDLAESKELSALVLPVVRTLGQQLKTAL